MSLRKSPTRTPALLAANRANAQKSTGPRTPEGKGQVALNALRHGLRARRSFSYIARSPHAQRDFSGLYNAVYAALLPGAAGVDLLKKLDRFWQGGVQEGVRRRLAFQTKPQYVRKQRGSENVVTPLRIGIPSTLW